MADIPVPKSRSEILGNMIAAFCSRFGIKSLIVGGPILSFLEAGAQADLRNSQDIFNLLASSSLDSASGVALDALGADEGLTRLSESPSTGTVTIKDSSFNKIQTKIFAGLPGPIIGSTSLNVSDASTFPSTGDLYIGRGTQNYEGPLPYIAKVNNGIYWTITLSSPGTLRYHLPGETVLLAQGGNRTISAATVVSTPLGNAVAAVSFKTIYSATIPDGENEITGVLVAAIKPGVLGNVGAATITSFSSNPFPGATVTNPLPFSNGTAAEDDSTFRDRIRKARQSRVKGTALALTTYATGVVSPEDNKRVLSSSVVDKDGEPTTLYIDDGTGYEERSEGIAIESFIDLALGGEKYFKVSASRPVTKAYVESSQSAPFTLTDGQTLGFLVGGVLTQHTFSSDQFISIDNATAYEVVASINGNSTLDWSARTGSQGTKVIVFAKADTNESIQNVATENDSNPYIGFPGTQSDTMRLYKNDVLLNKDGSIASLSSNPPSQWNGLSGSQTLILDVDGTGAVTYTFTDQDFIDSKTGFVTLGTNTVTAWAAVFNDRLPGVTASVVAGEIVLTSNRGTSSRAQLEITGGTLVTDNMFVTQIVTGKNKNYTLDRNTGELSLVSPLVAGDKLTAGTVDTRAFLQTPKIPITTLLSDAHLWFAIDGGAKIINTSVSPAIPLLSTITSVYSWGHKLKLFSNTTNLWANVLAGDWIVFWDPVLVNLFGTYKVETVGSSGSYIEIARKEMATSRYAHAAIRIPSTNKVLVTGGLTSPGLRGVTAACEIYDPATFTWTPAAPMAQARAYHQIVALPNNKILVIGGATEQNSNGTGETTAATNACEIYDPGTNTWTNAANYPIPVWGHAVATGGGLDCLVSGGYTFSGGFRAATNTTNTYNYLANTWNSAGTLAAARAFHVSAALGSSQAMVSGGQNNSNIVLSSTEKYSAGAWTAAAAFPGGAFQHGAAVYDGTSTAYVGGGSSAAYLSTPVNLANFAAFTYGGGWTSKSPMGDSRSDFSMAFSTTNNKILVAGGAGAAFGGSAVTEEYTIGSNTWANRATPLSVTASHAERLGPVLIATGNTNNDFVMTGGLDSSYTAEPYSTGEVFRESTNAWYVPDSSISSPFSGGTYTLSNNGIAVVRAASLLNKTTIPAGSYASPGFALELDDELQGAAATVYRTTTMRVATNTFKDTPISATDPVSIGDIALVTADVQGQKTLIPISDAVVNVTGHLASVESGNPEYGTPDFHQTVVRGSSGNNTAIVEWSKDETGAGVYPAPSAAGPLVFLRDFDDGTSSTATHLGLNKGFYSYISDIQYSSLDTVTLRKPVETAMFSGDRAYFASPYELSYTDQLALLIDGDVESKRFAVPMGRKISPTNNTYALQNAFVDADNGDQSLAVAFGFDTNGFDFDDFAIFMAARAVTDKATSSKSILWRYFRLGPDGNYTRVRYVLPDGINQTVSVNTDTTTDEFTNVSISLSSGALKTGYPLNSFDRVGTVAAQQSNGLTTVTYILGYPVAAASRTGGFTTLTLNLPTGVNHTGLAEAETINFISTSPITFPSGNYVITNITESVPSSGKFDQIQYADATAGTPTAGAIGVVYLGANQISNLSGATPAVAQGDFFRLDSGSSLDSDFEGFTIRISTNPVTNPYWFSGVTEEFGGSVTDTVTLAVIGDSTTFKVFVNPAATATSLAAAVNGQILSDASISVIPTVVGSGTGVIDRSSAETAGAAPAWTRLTDGINYVETTTIPSIISNNYQFKFKNAINSDLVSNADWENEDIRLVPRSGQNVIDWLNAPTVSGLFSVCDIVKSSRAARVQIASLSAGSAGSVQIQGGRANGINATILGTSVNVNDETMVSKIAGTDAEGMFAGQWAVINNTIRLPKDIITSATDLASISTDGEFIFTVGDVYSEIDATANCLALIEKQGDFVCITDTKLGSSFDVSGVVESCWVRITSPASVVYNKEISQPNTGIYRVIRVVSESITGGGSFWIENSSVVEQGLAECDIYFYTPDSMMPGDTLKISTTLWGVGNRGEWTIETVGDDTGEFTDPLRFKVVTTDVATQPVSVSPGALGAQYPLVQVIEKNPGRYFKRILSIAPNPSEPTLYDIKFDTAVKFGNINNSAGSIISILDKLAFPIDIANGIDGYKHSVGLIGEVNQVIYGNPANSTVYPGVVAAGANVNISGPLVKRIQIGVAIRVRSGASTQDISDQVKSSIAALINETGIGVAIALSDIVSAVSKVGGVVAVTMLSPDFSTGDLINVQPFEKPLVLDIDKDITVSFIGQ